MTGKKKIRSDRLVLALLSSFRILVGELVKRGVIDRDNFIGVLQQTAIANRKKGDPNNVADAIHEISLLLDLSLPEPPPLKGTVRIKRMIRKRPKS